MHDSRPQRIFIGLETPDEAPPRFAFAALLAGNVALAFGPWLVRLADVGPVASAFWRLALAAPMLLLLTCLMRQPIPRLHGGLWLMLALGGVLFAADLGTWHIGIFQTKLANATLFANASSFVFAAYGFVIARAMPGRNQAAALLLAAFGAALLLGRSYELSRENLVGDLFCLAAGMFYAGYLVAVDRARGILQPLPTLAVATLFAVGPLLLFAVLLGETVIPGNWTPLVLLALVSQVVGQGLMVYAIGNLPPVVIGLGLLTQPLTAATIGWIVYDERLAAADLAGALAIAVALVLVRRPDRKNGPEAA